MFIKVSIYLSDLSLRHLYDKVVSCFVQFELFAHTFACDCKDEEARQR